MAKKREDGVIDIHLKFYPEKFASHQQLIEKLRLYQRTMGLGMRDAFVMIMLHPETQGEQEAVKVSAKETRRNLTQESGSGKDRNAAKLEAMGTEASLIRGEMQEAEKITENTAVQENAGERGSILPEELLSDSDDMESVFSSDFYGGSV